MGAPGPSANAAFDSYARRVESQLVECRPIDSRRNLVTGKITPSAQPPGALLHHWRGTAFAPGAHVSDFERVMRDVTAYPSYFAPQITQASLVAESSPDRLQMQMRAQQHHVITVVMDATYDVTFARRDPAYGYSISRSTRIDEIADDRPLSSGDEHGFLWRLNTYWTYEERDGGLYLRIETISLTRSIPRGLGFLIGPFVESVPRDSIEFTLRSVLKALAAKK